MKIGIDMSQTIYETGVGNLLTELVSNLTKKDKKNFYVLMFSGLRKRPSKEILDKLRSQNVTIKFFKYPPSFLDFLWNRLHIVSIENFLGPLDVFISSDWTEPPAKHAKKMTILYDLVVYKASGETDKKIISVQKRKLKWVKKESKMIICISESTKKDAEKILGIEKEKLRVIYPGTF